MRDHRRQPLAGDGAEKEFPRAWGLLHETMKTKFGVDKLDFSTTTLQLTGHDDVIHRCTVKIYKPRNFQATGEGYSSRVAESRCAAMACITLRVCMSMYVYVSCIAGFSSKCSRVVQHCATYNAFIVVDK